MGDEGLEREYYAIVDTVGRFDERVLTVKGWGVTLSLAALAWGFQDEHYGLFLVAALSGLAFWLIEGVFKRHQMRYYLRMRDIEVLEFERAGAQGAAERSTPRIDWSWDQAARVYSKQSAQPHPMRDDERRWSYTIAWLFPHVMLPHALSVVAGVALFLAARHQLFGFASGWKW